MQAQREFAYSQMVIKPSFLRSGRETEIEIKRLQTHQEIQKASVLCKKKKKTLLD